MKRGRSLVGESSMGGRGRTAAGGAWAFVLDFGFKPRCAAQNSPGVGEWPAPSKL